MVAHPGELLLLDTSHPMHCVISQGRHRTIMLQLDRETLLPQLASSDLPAVQRLTGDFQMGGLLDNYLRSLANLAPDLPDATNRTLVEQFCGLVAITLGASEESRESIGQTGLKAARLRAIQEYMGQCLDDPALNPVAVAAHFGISARYLHKLFAVTGNRFSRWLQFCRLERCRREFTDPTQDARSITEIAYRWGFNDLSHFGRRFRVLYGMSPRDMRSLRRQTR